MLFLELWKLARGVIVDTGYDDRRWASEMQKAGGRGK